jgi:hypothetical protein
MHKNLTSQHWKKNNAEQHPLRRPASARKPEQGAGLLLEENPIGEEASFYQKPASGIFTVHRASSFASSSDTQGAQACLAEMIRAA